MASLARRGDVTVRQLSWYNPKLRTTRRGRLLSGQSVLFPSSAVVRAARNVPDPSIEKYGTSRGRTITHVVRPGESLWSIAKKYKTTATSIQRLNGFKKSVIFPGQIIIVKGTPARGRGRSTSAGAHVHVVKPGETLGGIAQKYDTTTKALKELNGLHSDLIRAGQKLIVGG